MSCSPERMSSYRRHFESSNSSLALQVRVSSPSPTRRDHPRSSSYSATAASSMRAGSMGRRTMSSTRKFPVAGANSGVLCVGFGMEAPIDLDAAAVENQEFLTTRSGERKEMIVLNDRLAAYIEKVRSLEQHNMLLETEIEAMKNRFLKPSGLRMLYEEQLKELMQIADQMKVQRDMAVAARSAMATQLEILKAQWQEAVEQRRQAEMDVEAFRPDVDAATSKRIALEKQLEQLEAEIEFLQKIQKQEIEELMKQIYSAHGKAQSAFGMPDLSAALKQIQAQYDDIAAKNLQEMDNWYSSKFEDLNNKSSKNVDKVRSVREEITSAKKDIQNKERELDALKTKNDALEAQISETQERHKKEMEELQKRIAALQFEMKSTKEKMALLLREYQELLNVKMSLEIEITTYRKLIEGEDSRLASMVQNLSLTSNSLSASSTSMGVGVAGSMVGSIVSEISGGTNVRMRGGMGNNVNSNSTVVNGVGINGAAVNGNNNGTGENDGSINGAAISNGTGETNGGGNGAAVSSSTDGNGSGNCAVNTICQDQAVEVIERKTVLIRTIRTEENILESDTVEQTITTTGAADDTEFDQN